MYERMFIHVGVSKHEDSVLTRVPAKNKHNLKNPEQNGDFNRVKPTASAFTGALQVTVRPRGWGRAGSRSVQHRSATGQPDAPAAQQQSAVALMCACQVISRLLRLFLPALFIVPLSDHFPFQTMRIKVPVTRPHCLLHAR